MSYHGKKAEELFLAGYNCSQSVAAAFCDILEIDERTLLRISSSFGGGLARIRELCGAVSGMAIVAGLLYGYEEAGNISLKTEHYQRIRELAGAFRERCGSIVCRELLGVKGDSGTAVPEERTSEYYKKRPCPSLVRAAGEILDEYIEKNPPQRR